MWCDDLWNYTGIHIHSQIWWHNDRCIFTAIHIYNRICGCNDFCHNTAINIDTHFWCIGFLLAPMGNPGHRQVWHSDVLCSMLHVIFSKIGIGNSPDPEMMWCNIWKRDVNTCPCTCEILFIYKSEISEMWIGVALPWLLGIVSLQDLWVNNMMGKDSIVAINIFPC